MSSWAMARPRGILAASTISTLGGSSSRSDCGASRSATTTSASASICRPRTVISPGSPGPPPTKATPPVRWRYRRALSAPDRRPPSTASLMSALRRGSPLSTPTCTSPACPEAGVQAAEAAATSYISFVKATKSMARIPIRER